MMKTNENETNKCETCNEKLKTHIILGWLLVTLLTIIIIMSTLIFSLEETLMFMTLSFIILLVLGTNKRFNNKYVIDLVSLEYLVFSKKLSCLDCDKPPKKISSKFFFFPIIFSVYYFQVYGNWKMALFLTISILVFTLWGNKKIF